jgi:ATP-dependent DNA helicase RecQ
MTQELEKLQQMADYCHTENCLQEFILKYFGETETESCGRCGNCLDSRSRIDVTKEAQMVMSCVIRMGQRFGKNLTAQVLTGSKNKKVTEMGFDKLSTYGIMKNQGAKEVGDFIEFLISQELIAIEQGQFPTIFVAPKGKEVLLGKQQVNRREAVQVKQVSKNDPLFEYLREVRKRIAETENVPPFVIFSDAALKDMCAKQPKTNEEFLQVSGVGEHKLQKYGLEFIQAIRKFLEENPEYQSEEAPASNPPKKSAKRAVRDSHLETYSLYKENLSLNEIAEKRDLSLKTIEEHIIQCAQQGMEVEFTELIPGEYLPLLEQAVEAAGRSRLKPIKELLPEEVSYFMIKAYLYFLSK